MDENMLNKILNKYYGGTKLENLHPSQQEKVLNVMQNIDEDKDINNLHFCPWILESKTIV